MPEVYAIIPLSRSLFSGQCHLSKPLVLLEYLKECTLSFSKLNVDPSS
jgi:hypothetical protein